MKELEEVLGFLEEFGLLRPEDGRDRPGVGAVEDDTDEVFEVDWEVLTSTDQAEDTLANPVGSWNVGDILGGLGLARDAAERRHLAERAVREPWDTCAWCQPIQLFGPDWGIFIGEDRLGRIASEIGCFAWSSPRTPATARHVVTAAFFAPFLHEHLHHKVEAFGVHLTLAHPAAPDHWHR